MRIVPVLMAVLIATAALAHTGVKDPQVMARMQGMSKIAEATKVVGQMVQGKTAFDRDAVIAAAAVLTQETARIPEMFETRADDPKSEALPAIWDNWEDFKAKADDGVSAADLVSQAASPDDLKAAVARLGQTCKACHADYRE